MDSLVNKRRCFILLVFSLLCCIWFFPINSVGAVEEETIATKFNFQNGIPIPDYFSRSVAPTTSKYVQWMTKTVGGGYITYYYYTFSLPEDLDKLTVLTQDDTSGGKLYTFFANGKSVIGKRHMVLVHSNNGEFYHESIENINMAYNVPNPSLDQWANSEGKVLFSNIPIQIDGKLYGEYDGSYVPPKNCEIIFPTKGSTVTGYLPPAFDIQANQGLLMDIKVKGSFKWNLPFGSTTKSYLTSIQNSFIVKLGDKTKSVLGGVGVKTVLDMEEQLPKKGDTVNFTVTLYIPVWQKGDNLDLTVGYSCYDDGEWTYFSDSITVTTTQTNSDIVDGDEYIPPQEGESNGSVDGEGGWFPEDNGLPSKPTTDSILDWLNWLLDTIIYIVKLPFKLIIDVINTTLTFLKTCIEGLLSVFQLLNGCFTFIPNEIKNVIWACVCLGALGFIFKRR